MGQPSRQGSALFSVRLELWRSTGPATPSPVQDAGVIIPSVALSRLGPPGALQSAEIGLGCRDNASNFFWLTSSITS
jgi:hypothetical protein